MGISLGPKRPYFGLKGGWLTFWVTVACATDMTLFGYDQGVFGGVIVTPNFLEVHDLTGKTGLIGTVTALYDIGCFVGAVVACWLGEVLGRKKAILVGTTIMTVGAVIQIASFSVPQMIVGRIIAGIGNGINTATAPVWQTETSQAKWRGKLVVIELIMNIFGFMLSNWMTFGFSFVGGPISWRFPLAFQLVFIMIIYVTVPWLPESPRWLIAHGYEDEAFTILADVEDKSPDDPFILAQHKEIVFTVQYEAQNAPKWSELLTGKTKEGTKTIRRMLLGAGTQFMQQFSGINVTSYYLPTVLISSVGLSNTMARLLAACNAVSYLLFSLIGVPNVEKWGRRKMLMFAAGGQGFCYLIITILLRFNEKDGYGGQRVNPDVPTRAQAKVASASVAFFFLYYVFFGIGMQGVPWLYPTEINALPMRTKGAALGAATNWICNFIVVEITPIGIETLRWKFYIIWVVFNLSFVPIVYFLYPETAGRTLEDLDAYYRTSPPLLVFRDEEVISSKRPARFLENENEEVRRASGVDVEAFRRGSRVGMGAGGKGRNGDRVGGEYVDDGEKTVIRDDFRGFKEDV